LERCAVICLVPFVDDLLLQNLRDEIISNTLNLVALVEVVLVQCLRKCENTALRIGRNNLDVLVVFLQTTRETSDCATSTSTGDKRCDLALCLLPDFLGGAKLVGERVVRVRVLVEDMCVWELLHKLPRNTNVTLRAVPGGASGCTDDLSTQCLQNRDLLRAHLLGQSDNGLVTLDSGHKCETDTSVAGSGLNESVAGLYAS
jgi:hypothetical protein